METMDNVKIGKEYKIVGFDGEVDKVLRRFFELGFTIGQSVKVVSTSLQKKVFLVQIRGYLLSVRANLLSKVQVKA